MRNKTLRQAIFCTTAALSLGYVSVLPAYAQETRAVVQGLYENQAYIRACRQTNQTTEVFDNTSLSPVANRIGTLATGTQVRLTGVLSNGRAQVYLPNSQLSSVQPMGWINAGHLTNCGSAPPPTTRACFRADTAINVRSLPTTGSGSQIVNSYGTGGTIYATTNPPTQRTSPNTAPDFGRVWMEVAPSTNQTGWISRTGTYGQGSNVTSINCP
jgi:hypothetical protein